MGKKSKQIIYYILSLILVVTAPILFLYFIASNKDEVFYERVREDQEICRQRAKQDSVDTRWCDEIKDAATLAYKESTRRRDFSFTEILFFAVFIILAIRVGNLTKQVKELKEKIDV